MISRDPCRLLPFFKLSMGFYRLRLRLADGIARLN